MIERLKRISASLARHGIAASRQRCEVGLVLGSSLGHLAEAIDDARAIDDADIDGFPRSTTPLHVGRSVFGTLQGRRVMAFTQHVSSEAGAAGKAYVFLALGHLSQRARQVASRAE